MLQVPSAATVQAMPRATARDRCPHAALQAQWRRGAARAAIAAPRSWRPLPSRWTRSPGCPVPTPVAPASAARPGGCAPRRLRHHPGPAPPGIRHWPAWTPARSRRRARWRAGSAALTYARQRARTTEHASLRHAIGPGPGQQPACLGIRASGNTHRARRSGAPVRARARRCPDPRRAPRRAGFPGACAGPDPTRRAAGRVR